jgi:hypothetical protein
MQPLQGDFIDLLIDVALHDTNRKVRAEAAYGLSQQPSDVRALAPLEQILTEMNAQETLSKTDRMLRNNARYALKHHRKAGKTTLPDTSHKRE